MRLIDADYILSALGVFTSEEPESANFMRGIRTAREIVENAPTVAIGDRRAVIKWTPDLDKFARDVAYRGLNEFSFMGKSIREWFEIIMEHTARGKQSGWISAEDKLPDLEEQVLIVCEWTGRSGEKYREIVLDSFKAMSFLGYKPLFWMPLPEEPKEGNGDG